MLGVKGAIGAGVGLFLTLIAFQGSEGRWGVKRWSCWHPVGSLRGLGGFRGPPSPLPPPPGVLQEELGGWGFGVLGLGGLGV